MVTTTWNFKKGDFSSSNHVIVSEYIMTDHIFIWDSCFCHLFFFLQCPQCNRKCTLKDVRKLFASRLVAIDGESQKVTPKFRESIIFLKKHSISLIFMVCTCLMQRIRSLEAKCISLEKKVISFTGKRRRKKKMPFNLVLFCNVCFMDLSNYIQRRKFVECFFK